MEWRLLADVPTEEVRELLQVARRRRFARGEVVFHRDDPGDALHLIQKGRFAVHVMTPLGETATVAIRGPGDSFGEMALLTEDWRRTATVTALEAAETFAVYKNEFARLRRSHQSVTDALASFLVNEVRVLNERLLEALYVPVERRILRRVVELSTIYAWKDGEIRIPLTQEVIAELAGTSRAAVNRVLNAERKRGTIGSSKRGVTVVLDRDELARRAR